MRLRDTLKARPREVLVFALRLADMALVWLLGLVAYWVRHDLGAPSPLQWGLLAIAPFVFAAALSVVGCYAPRRVLNIAHTIKTVILGGALAAFVLLTLGYITKSTEDFSRIWLGVWGLTLTPALIGLRLVARRVAARLGAAGVMRRRVALIGCAPTLTRLETRIRDTADQVRIDIAFVVTVDPHRPGGVKAALAEIGEACAGQGVPDDFVLAFPGDRTEILEQVVAGIRHYWANIDVCPDHAFIGLPFRDARSIGGVPLMRLVTRPFEGGQGVMKWLEDKVLGGVFLVPGLVLMVLIALAIKIDSRGPVLFRQTRFGFGNHPITVLKFRTMHADTCDEGAQQATEDDPRVTRLGRFLRRASLDELPQLFNVLGGSMSLIGPRPHAVPHNLEFAPLVRDYLSRHRIKPGMTGWAQVNGFRGEITSIELLRKRVEYDLFYIENWSLELDMVILARTAVVVVTGKNAH